jgi:hypothetical protein
MNLHLRISNLEGRCGAPSGELTNEQRSIRFEALRKASEHDPDARERFSAACRILDKAAARLAEVKA